mgnify:FL=1
MLTQQQIEKTKNELEENFKKTNLTIDGIADELKCSPEYLKRVFNLNSLRIEDPWILRNFLIDYLTQNNTEITPFTALVGNCEDYIFLDSTYINNGKIIE